MPALKFERLHLHCPAKNQLRLMPNWHAFVLIPVSSVFHDSSLDNPEPAIPINALHLVKNHTIYIKKQ